MILCGVCGYRITYHVLSIVIRCGSFVDTALRITIIFVLALWAEDIKSRPAARRVFILMSASRAVRSQIVEDLERRARGWGIRTD